MAARVLLAELGDLYASALREEGVGFAVACGRPAESFEGPTQQERRLLLEDPQGVITRRHASVPSSKPS
ncbi:MAG: hypothetical protein JWM10_4289 [Myxococcaceae bacterium]|nr:hypothetical protein [Myxococcaceae bacterium]